MKKVLSIVLAVAMLFTMSVMAFAEIKNPKTINGTAGEDNTAIVKTSTVDKDGKDATWYKVTFPAETVIAWGDTAPNAVEYKVESQLAYDKVLNVTVTTEDSTMSASEAANTATLAYVLGGNVDVKTATAVANESYAASVTVAEAQWAAAPVGEYSDTLTFTATVVNAD
ncbi:MAG: hypothetical protein J1F23_00760 [Oscillospiraceae bacterium]|nr:hypothetical protein [Oscillospiraceae bacterium]